MDLNELSTLVEAGKAKQTQALVQQAIDEKIPASEILSALMKGMDAVGVKFKANQVFVPEVLMSARSMNKGMELLKALLKDSDKPVSGRACIGTIKGDRHDIGKNLVKMMMEGKGIEVIDLGIDVAPEIFVKTAAEQGCRIICCSAMLTTTMVRMKEIVALAEEAGIRDNVYIMVGGAPLSQEFCDQIGADMYTPDAASAAEVAAAFLSRN